MFLYIRKHHLFASFASYSLHNIRTDSPTNIRFDAKNSSCSEYSLQSEFPLIIFSCWRIFAPKYLFRSEDLQTLSEFHIQANYLLANIRIQANFRLHIRIPANIRTSANIRYLLLQII
jgi:hypothetical protein